MLHLEIEFTAATFCPVSCLHSPSPTYEKLFIVRYKTKECLKLKYKFKWNKTSRKIYEVTLEYVKVHIKPKKCLFKILMEKWPQNCLVFFTFLSSCVDFCLIELSENYFLNCLKNVLIHLMKNGFGGGRAGNTFKYIFFQSFLEISRTFI